jgi:ABC-2 type transport system ATP-binding protein
VAIIRSGEIVEVAETENLTRRSLNRLTVRFKQSVELNGLGSLPGVEVLSRPSPTSLTLQVAGDMERLIQVLGGMPVLDIETQRPSLEEVFLTYYKK